MKRSLFSFVFIISFSGLFSQSDGNMESSCNVSVTAIAASNSLTCDGAIVFDFSSCSGFPYDVIFSTNCPMQSGIPNISSLTYTLSSLCPCQHPIDMVIYNGSNETYYSSVMINYNVTTLVSEKIHNNGIFIKPNPSSDFINIDSKVNLDRIVIKNSNGNFMESFKVDNMKSNFDIRNLSNGFYFIELYNDRQLLEVKKVIISR